MRSQSVPVGMLLLGRVRKKLSQALRRPVRKNQTTSKFRGNS